MRNSIFWLLFISGFISACTDKQEASLAAFEVYCEMVANDAKPMALHNPMESKEVDEFWNDFIKIADDYNVHLYREDDFPVSILFPAELTKDKTVVVIYKEHRLQQYKQWKTDLLADGGSDPIEAEVLARRFGRLMGYGPHGINQLISKISDYRSLESFKVTGQVTHLYYEDVQEAANFYNNSVGLNEVNTGLFQISDDAFIHLHPFDDAHFKGQPKSTAIAFLTDQLPEWYQYVKEEDVPIKYTYKPRDGGPHDGFVAIDPGGYLLEFEQFKQHPENELFMAALAQAPRIEASFGRLNFYGSITWTYHQDLLLMQKFYEDVLGYQLVADQGWTKIYQTSPTGFIGLVDERRGMEDYADTKAVEIEWNISDVELFNAYAKEFWQEYKFENNSFIGPEQYIYHIRESEITE